jgi:hypothetical protein
LEQVKGLPYPVSGISAWDRFSDHLDRPVVALGDAGIGGCVPGWQGPPPRASMCAPEQPPGDQLDARDHKRRFSPQNLLPYSGLRRHARGWVTSKLKRLSIVTISSP